MHGQTPLGPSGMPMNIHQQQAMVAHQSNNMEIMERRHRERQAAERTANPQGVSSRFFFLQAICSWASLLLVQRPPRPEDDDSGGKFSLAGIINILY